MKVIKKYNTIYYYIYYTYLLRVRGSGFGVRGSGFGVAVIRQTVNSRLPFTIQLQIGLVAMIQ